MSVVQSPVAPSEPVGVSVSVLCKGNPRDLSHAEQRRSEGTSFHLTCSTARGAKAQLSLPKTLTGQPLPSFLHCFHWNRAQRNEGPGQAPQHPGLVVSLAFLAAAQTCTQTNPYSGYRVWLKWCKLKIDSDSGLPVTLSDLQ